MPRTQPEREDDEDLSYLFGGDLQPITTVVEKEDEQQQTKKLTLNSEVKVANLFKKPEAKTPYKKFSAWLVTVVPNIQWTDTNDPRIQPYADMLAGILKSLISDQVEFMSVLNFPLNVRNKEIDWSKSRTKATVERGSIKGIIHAHLIIQINHNTRLQLGYAKIKAWIKKQVNRIAPEQHLPVTKNGNFHVDCKLLDQLSTALEQTRQIEEYIDKCMGEETDTTVNNTESITYNTDIETTPPVAEPTPPPALPEIRTTNLKKRKASEILSKVPFKKLALPDYSHLLVELD